MFKHDAIRNSDQLVVTPWQESAMSGEYWVDRVNTEGQVEHLFTSFDHACIAGWRFSSTHDFEQLERDVDVLVRRVILYPNGPCWHFSSAVTDIPPDIDTTSAALRCLVLAERGSLNVNFDLPESFASIFANCHDPTGGLLTYLSPRFNNVFDPVANLRVANLLLDTATDQDLLANIVSRIDSLVDVHGWRALESPFYIGPWLLIEQAAEAISRSPQLWTGTTIAEFDHFLTQVEPLGIIQRATLAYAASVRNLDTLAQIHADALRSLCKSDSWPWEPIYMQRTPLFYYGSELITKALVERAMFITNRETLS